ncbi:hypothetical protein VN24_21765 [Paenibacillus beijingensis]|uniref:PucR family transcriptional regulator n=1 Tax=Paenibacillus beijingensis TaxID=1126833 RepID=A0A0D5NRG7_9BACL|nr:hypothetical protein VN24_21765 [Paenibacillus beijingensis]
MDTEYNLTVQEALSRPLFRNAVVVAGESGLIRPIRWVHILEVTDFETLIHGGEMILTTGIGLRSSPELWSAFAEKLIRQNASCLCIEVGPYFNAVENELKQLADEHGFPVILFPSTVRYVDITHDLHSLLVNRQHLRLRELESLSREFHRHTLGLHGTLNVLKLLHESTGAQLLFRPLTGKTISYPPLYPQEQSVWSAYADERYNSQEEDGNAQIWCTQIDDGRYAVTKPIGAYDQTWALLLMITDQQPTEYDLMLADSASLSIAQELLRTRYMEERKLFSEHAWVGELIGGRAQDEKSIRALTGTDYKRWDSTHYYTCIIEIANRFEGKPDTADSDWDSLRLHLSHMVRSDLEKHFFQPFMTLHQNRIAIIAFDTKASSGSAPRLKSALGSFQHSHSGELPKQFKLLIGAGGFTIGLNNARQSYLEAEQALSLFPSFGEPVLLYDELGVYQLLAGLNDGKLLQQFVRQHLGPLIDHDETRGSELLLTLKALLDCDGSKQAAAQRLFIVRQSLYYRLDKIAELLGEDYMTPEKRLALGVALRAYQLLQPAPFIDSVKISGV